MCVKDFKSFWLHFLSLYSSHGPGCEGEGNSTGSLFPHCKSSHSGFGSVLFANLDLFMWACTYIMKMLRKVNEYKIVALTHFSSIYILLLGFHVL